MKIYLIGAQGTRKTTLLNEIKERKLLPSDSILISEVARNLITQYKVEVNEKSTPAVQSWIFNIYQYLFIENSSFVSDRSLLDVLAYTKNICPVTYQQQISLVRDFLWREKERRTNSLYFYLPIEFSIVEDGVRSIDTFYQKQIDFSIRELVDYLNIPTIQLTGTVEQRINLFKETLGI